LFDSFRTIGFGAAGDAFGFHGGAAVTRRFFGFGGANCRNGVDQPGFFIRPRVL
jgi:hypothetical protein